MNAVILAGGQNKRIGLKKAFLEIDGKPIIEKMIEVLRPLFSEIIVIAKDRKEFAHLEDVTVAEDAFEGHSSLIGVYSGLVHSNEKYNFFFACDMPFLNIDLIRYVMGLHKGYDVIIPKPDGKYEALHAIYSKACLKAFKHNLKNDEFKIINAFKDLKVREVASEEINRFDSHKISFFNINTQADYEKAQRIKRRESC